MSKTIAQIIAEAEEIRVETDPNGNTADRVGTAIKDVAEYVEGVEDDVSQQSEDISTLQETVAGHTEEIEMARLASGTFAIVDGSIKTGGGWSTNPASSLFLPIVEDATIVIKWSPSTDLFSFSFLSALDLVSGNYTYADGYTGWISYHGTRDQQTLIAPNDARFLYLAHNYEDIISITVDGIEVYSNTPAYRLINTQKSVRHLNGSVILDSDLTTDVGTNLASQSLVEDFLISNVGTRTQSTTWKSVTINLRSIPVGTQLTFGGFYLGRGGYYAFYGNGALISYGVFKDPRGTTTPITTTVPSGADTLYFDVKSPNSVAPTGWDTPYDELMCNKGATLLPFVPYAEFVTAIKGIPLAGQMSGGGGGGDIIVDLPTSADGSDIQTGYAYINSSTGIVTVKL